jgi:hypothetical protein
MKLGPALVLLVIAAACDAQVDARYAGPVLVRLRGTAVGFGPDDRADAAALRWNTQRGADLTHGPSDPIPLESAPPAAFSLLVLSPPPDDVYFGFDGEPARIAEATPLLTAGDAVIGRALDHVLVYVDGAVAAGSLAAGYLGEPLAPGFHLRDTRATAELSPAQAQLAARCGGGDACRAARLYRLAATRDGLATEIAFFPVLSLAAGEPAP